MRTSIKYKAILFVALLLMLALGTSSYLVLQGIGQNQQLRYENQLAQQVQTANLYIRQDYAKTRDIRAEDFLRGRGYELARQIGLLTGTHAVLYDMKGEEIGNSYPGLNSIDTKDSLLYAIKNKTVYQISEQSLYYLAPIELSNAQVGVVQLYYSLKAEQEFYNNIKTLFIRIGSLIFILSFVFGYLYFSRMTGKISRLKQAVENIKQGDYRAIPEIKSKDELGDLRQGIYFMSSQIEQNIADMQEEQRKLSLAVEKLKSLEQQQRQFIGNVTHEFKTPLTVIKAYADLLEMYPEDMTLLRDAKQSIAKETQRLQEMVEKTLQLAALEKYEFEMDMQSVAVDELLGEVIHRMDGKIQRNNLRVNKDLKSGVIWADKESMFQVFVNLLDNAIKYNKPNGSIEVRSFTQNNKVYVEIKDTGIGIPEDSLSKIFEPFYTVDKARSRQYGGTGLGLALVRQLVEKQAGTISILESSEAGTRFMLEFPKKI